MIPLFKVHMPKDTDKELKKVFDSGMITEGIYSDKFEHKFGKFINNKNSCLVNSCTSALTLAYRMCDLQPGDEIIVTPLTCMATNEPAHLMGAKLVWADIDPSTGNICPDSVRKKINKRTKVISAVHWAGQPFEIDEINDIASQYGTRVVEDAAHALGASYKGSKIGSLSDFTCFSFQAIKHLTTGDGGAITCLSEDDANRIRKLRWFGLDRKFAGSKWTQDITESGYKFHMNNINACIGIKQMEYIEEIIRKHKENSLFFDQNINNKKIEKLKRNEYSESSSWIYTVKAENKYEFQKFLLENGIQSDPVHVRNDKYSVFKEYALKEGSLPGADEFCSKHISIPVGWWLSEDDRRFIVETVNRF